MEALLQVPHRLLTLTLLPGLELCLLCGPRPPLSQLDPQVNSGRVLLSLYYTVCPRSPPFPLHPPWEAPRPRPPRAPPSSGPAPRAALQSPSPQLGPFHPDPILPVLAPSTVPVPSALCPNGPRLLPTPHPRPRDHAPYSFWTAGGSHCWTRCEPACLWDPERCPLASPCTRTSWGTARVGGVAGSSSLLALAMTPSFSRLLLLHLELKRCLFTVEPSGNKGD